MTAATLIAESKGTVAEAVTLAPDNCERRFALAGTVAICEIDQCRMKCSSGGPARLLVFRGELYELSLLAREKRRHFLRHHLRDWHADQIQVRDCRLTGVLTTREREPCGTNSPLYRRFRPTRIIGVIIDVWPIRTFDQRPTRSSFA